jgi:hypothetical protein
LPTAGRTLVNTQGHSLLDKTEQVEDVDSGLLIEFIQKNQDILPLVDPGAWHDADMDGDKVDSGGCINTLTTYLPSPFGKGNGPPNSIITQVTKT